MRKDAKIGLAIGGVLLAVLIAYITVVPKRHSAGSANAVALAIPPAAPADSAVAPLDKPAADTPADSKPDATAHNDAVNWEKLLGVNADAPQPLANTQTPASGNAAAPPAAHSAEAANPTPAAEVPIAGANSAPPVSFTPAPVVAAAPTHTAEPFTGPRTYVVKSGQTLSSIAADVYGNQRFYVAILRANPNLNPKQLHPGMKITLPDISDVRPDESATSIAAASNASTASGHTYTVKSGDTLYRISQKLFGSPRQAEAIYDLNRETIGPDEAKLRLGMVLKLPDSALAGATASTR